MLSHSTRRETTTRATIPKAVLSEQFPSRGSSDAAAMRRSGEGLS